MTIDKERLRQLVADPKAKTKAIAKALGYTNDATFYYALKMDAEAKEIFDSRPGARAKSGTKKSSKRATRKGSKKSTSADTPPPHAACQARC